MLPNGLNVGGYLYPAAQLLHAGKTLASTASENSGTVDTVAARIGLRHERFTLASNRVEQRHRPCGRGFLMLG